MGPESASDQCAKDRCKGCPDCIGEPRGGKNGWFLEPVYLHNATSEQIRSELTRRRSERRKKHVNAKTSMKIRILENEIEKLKKELL